MNNHLLNVSNLSVDFTKNNTLVRAVDDISFHVDEGEILGIAGESGSGKSVSTTAMVKLLNPRSAKISGEVSFEGKNILKLTSKALRAIRGRDISMIFQDPMNSLTPVYTVGQQIVEQIRTHQSISRSEAKKMAIDLLDRVRIPAASRRVHSYPHELSGGMRQRVAIAMALSCNPKLLIADEPTTALDVTTQAQVLGLMRELKDEFGTAIILITHDMGVLAGMCDRIQIMYSGRTVESGPRREVLDQPRHPYTWGLLGAVPSVRGDRARRLVAIPGSAPGAQPVEQLQGCGFRDRCPVAFDKCVYTPPLEPSSPNPHHVDACWLEPGERGTRRAEVEQQRLYGETTAVPEPQEEVL
ncbi:ABC transporter ATP-binding protein [Brevibacterium aurantiacum]|uniref:ABC transporter ATP-binding protein n=1 Tax=Brevibacterium aurantiacum TaxID=273384 RepID=A0A2A3Z215_BREAU|nr:ABC transporter ATP-binding protein [Brevibacterium aurantiacum]PCC45523.1 ABC transporter ATP-binding protein [Brevibacterium aurantiacum]